MREKEGLTIREAAIALGVAPGTIRAHIRDGKLKAEKVIGKYGPEYRIGSGVLSAYCRVRMGVEVTPDELVQGQQQGQQDPPPDMRELYERLLSATEEATRYRVLCDVRTAELADAERGYQRQIAELQYQQVETEKAAATERERAEVAEQEIARLKSRGFWARVFGD